MLKKLLIIGVALTVLTAGIASHSQRDIPYLVVWSSYLLKEPFMEINREFEKAYNCKVVYGRAPEATLARAITKYDFSADVIATRSVTLKEAQTLGKIEEYKPLFESRWVIISLKENPVKVSSIKDLGKPGIRVGFCPKRTEYNDLSCVIVEKIVENAGIKEGFWKNIPEKVACGGVCALVLSAVKPQYLDYESMDRNSYYWQVFSHIYYKRADVCIVDEIFTRLPEVRDKIKIVPIDPEYIPHGSTSFGIGIVTYSRRKDMARKYLSFVLSEKGRKIFEKYNLKLVDR
ncbi:hypothetical protein DRP77_01450 [Candidatus Poribacteria bacterium]|nr:MAG: hypothetical protein DRP77_01450 [Candidatus Poribacteria bacterium]